jgi:hypothetical protein
MKKFTDFDGQKELKKKDKLGSENGVPKKIKELVQTHFIYVDIETYLDKNRNFHPYLLTCWCD